MPRAAIDELHADQKRVCKSCWAPNKAARTRALYGFAAKLIKGFVPGPEQLEVSMRKVTESLAAVVSCLYSNGLFLEEPALRIIRYHVARLGRHLQWLADHAVEHGIMAWGVTPKCHWFQHVPQQCELVNSRYVQNYEEKSLVGIAAKIYESSANGPQQPATIQHVFLIKQLVLVALRAAGHDSQ